MQPNLYLCLSYPTTWFVYTVVHMREAQCLHGSCHDRTHNRSIPSTNVFEVNNSMSFFDSNKFTNCCQKFVNSVCSAKLNFGTKKISAPLSVYVWGGAVLTVAVSPLGLMTGHNVGTHRYAQKLITNNYVWCAAIQGTHSTSLQGTVQVHHKGGCVVLDNKVS